MSDELANKLNDAQKHFSSHSYDQCAKVLSACPHNDTDPKVRANAIVVDYSKLGFAHTLQALNNMRGLVNGNNNSNNNSTSEGSNKNSSDNSNNKNSSNNSKNIPLVNVDSASWEFDGQDIVHYNEACLRAHTGDLDTALEVINQLLSAKAPVSPRVQLKASALAFVLKRQLAVRNANTNHQSTSSTSITNNTARDLQELLNSSAVKSSLSDSEYKEMQSLVAAATAQDLTGIQTWLDKNTSKGANDIAIFLNNSAVQLMYKNALAAAEDESENDNSASNNNNHLSHLYGGSGGGSSSNASGSATAAHLLTQAAAAADASSSSTSNSDGNGCPMQTATIKYNLGLAHFACGNFVAAIAAMVQVQRVMSDNASYWFRLGQMLTCLGREQAVSLARSKAEGVQQTRAQLLHEKGDRPAAAAVVVNTLSEGLIDLTSTHNSNNNNNAKNGDTGTNTPATTAATPTSRGHHQGAFSSSLLVNADGTPSFSCPQLFALADTALQNAWVLLIGRANNCNNSNLSLNSNAPAGPSGTASSPTTTKNEKDNSVSSSSPTTTNSASTTGILDMSSIVGQSSVGTQELLQSLIVHLTFVALSRGNNQVACKYVNDYFSVRCAVWNQHRDMTSSMLCYAVEALCTCNKAPQALKILQSSDLGELIVDSNFANGDNNNNNSNNSSGKGSGLLDQTYQDALLVNVCIAQIANGNWQKALSIGTSLLPRLYQRSPNAVLLAAYLELARGNREKALEIFEKVPLREPI